MKTFKYIIAFVLTAALIVAGAFLPTLASAVYDASTKGKIHHTDIEKPDINFGVKRDSYDMIEKLCIILMGQPTDFTDNFFITDIEAKHDAKDIPALALSAIEPYINVGLFDSFETYISDALKTAMKFTDQGVEPASRGIIPTGSASAENPANSGEPEVTITPTVYYIAGNAETHILTWRVLVIGTPTLHFSLLLDDETGAVLDIGFYSEKVRYVKDQQRDLLDTMCDIFFTSLGETDTLSYYRENGLIDNSDTSDLDGAFLSTGYRFTFGDEVYGQLALYLEVFERGFRSMLSYA